MAIFSMKVQLGDTWVTLRNAEPDDAQTLISLLLQMDTETTFLTREPGEFTMTEEKERAFIEARKQMPNMRFAVAEVDGRIVGMSDASYDTGLRYRHRGEVAISILRDYWGRGIGRTMMQMGIDWLQENGVEKVNLAVDTQNRRAIALYHSLGFLVEGTVRHDKRLPDGTYRDKYYMGLLLPRKETT